MKKKQEQKPNDTDDVMQKVPMSLVFKEIYRFLDINDYPKRQVFKQVAASIIAKATWGASGYLSGAMTENANRYGLRNPHTLVPLGLVGLKDIFQSFAFDYSMKYQNFMSDEVSAALSKVFQKAYMEQDIAFMQRNGGPAFSHAIAEASTAMSGYMQAAIGRATSILGIVAASGTMCTVHPVAGGVALVVGALLGVSNHYQAKVSSEMENDLMKTSRDNSEVINDVLKNASLIQRAAQTDKYKKMIEEKTDGIKKDKKNLTRTRFAFWKFDDILRSATWVAAAALATMFTKENSDQVADLMKMTASATSILYLTNQVTENWSKVSKCRKKYEHALGILMRQPKIKGGDKELKDPKVIKFKNITFGYPKDDDKKADEPKKKKNLIERFLLKNLYGIEEKKEDPNVVPQKQEPAQPKEIKPILEKFNLTIGTNERVALMGTSGSGKTTICSLLEHEYEPQEGNITIDGTDLKEFTLESLRSQISYVPQHSDFLKSSIRENLTLFNPKATDEEIKVMAQKMRIWDIIQGKGGLDADVNIGGGNFSGGEKQRLALVRALLANAPVTILDEPLSALDPVLRMEISGEIEKHFKEKNKAMIMVTHDTKSAEAADRIVILEKGKIVEQGRPADLWANKNSRYRQMCEKSQVNFEESQTHAVGVGRLRAAHGGGRA